MYDNTRSKLSDMTKKEKHSKKAGVEKDTAILNIKYVKD